MTWLIILSNVAVFVVELGLTPRGLSRFFSEYGLVPAAINLREAGTWAPLVTSMSVYGGWLHILSNMWALLIFGDNVEDRLGPLRYLTFYFLAGLVAGLLNVWLNADSGRSSGGGGNGEGRGVGGAQRRVRGRHPDGAHPPPWYNSQAAPRSRGGGRDPPSRPPAALGPAYLTCATIAPWSTTTRLAAM